MTLSRRRIAGFALAVILLVLASSLPAQESRFNELHARVADLYQRGRYADEVPVATEAVTVAEATFGPDSPKLATALGNLAVAYVSLSKFALAEPLFERALRIDEKAYAPENPNIAIDLDNLALVYANQDRYAKAEPLLLRALSVEEKAFGSENPKVASALNGLATLYFRQGEYAKAEPFFQRALALDEKAFGPENHGVALALNNLAMDYDVQGKSSLAEPLYLRALSIDEKALGPNHPNLATDLGNLASLYYHHGEFAKAESLDKRAIGIQEKALGPDSPNLATNLNNLASLYDLQGKYAEAEALYQRALSIHEKALGPEHHLVAVDLLNLGLLYVHQARYADAEPLYERAAQIDEKVLGPNHPALATDLNNLATLSLDRGTFADAEPLLLRALAIRQKAFGPEHPEVAQTLSNLASLYARQGRYTDAETLYLRALHIVEKALGPDNPEVATYLNDLAVLYDDKARYADAESLYRRALRIRETAFGPDHPSVALTLSNLGAVYDNLGRYTEAEPLYQRALRIDEKALAPDHRHLATDLNNLAAVYTDEGRYAEAQPLYQHALSINEKALGDDHPDIATGLVNLALLAEYQGTYLAAAPLYQRGIDNIFRQFQYNFTYMTERERLAFLSTVASNFPLYFSFVHRFHAQDPALIGSMYNLLLWEKGFIVGSVADLRHRVEASGDTEALKLLAELTAKRTQIAALLNVTPQDQDLWRKQIGQLQVEANEIEKSLVARSSVFAEQKNLERATWQQVRDALQPGEDAIEFARFNYHDKKWTGTTYYAALVVTHDTKDQPEYIFLGTDKQIEGDAITRFKQSVQTRGVTPEKEANLPSTDAYELIWKPLEKALNGVTRIYLSPDGILNQLPLGIIPGPDGKLEMEKYDLRGVSSTKDILRSSPARTGRTALLVGDPVFDLSEEQQRAALQKLISQQPETHIQVAASSAGTVAANAVSRDQGNNVVLPRLPGTGAEVNGIAELMQQHQWRTNVYTNDLALKRVVEQADRPRVVHLATHGFFLPDQPIKKDRLGREGNAHSGLEDPMLRSGLYFAGADRTLAGKTTAEGLDNGVLTALEAGNLDLRNTELVVLSACDTGEGDVQNGEGVFGLRRGLQEAGAQEVLMSLWSVPDKETLELMKRFYARWLAGVEVHTALKEAQLDMRKDIRASHDGKDLPFYWGAFVLIGR